MGLRNWHSEAAVLVILTHKVGDMLLCKWSIRLTASPKRKLLLRRDLTQAQPLLPPCSPASKPQAWPETWGPSLKVLCQRLPKSLRSWRAGSLPCSERHSHGRVTSSSLTLRIISSFKGTNEHFISLVLKNSLVKTQTKSLSVCL